MKSRASNDVAAQALTGAEADAMQVRLARMQVRDRERVAEGRIAATDLHLIPAQMARRAKVVFSTAAAAKFKVQR